VTHDEFVDLCTKLRALGANKVGWGEFSAEFTPASGSFRVGGQQPSDPPQLTPEQAKEAQRRRELGV
jgi:hypothetical protein